MILTFFHPQEEQRTADFLIEPSKIKPTLDASQWPLLLKVLSQVLKTTPRPLSQLLLSLRTLTSSTFAHPTIHPYPAVARL
jgi:hypothetical protein